MLQKRMSKVTTARPELDQEQRLFTFKATELIWLLLGLLEILIALRIGLKLIGANPDNLFAAFIYNFSDIFLFPFEGLIGTPSAGGLALELSSTIAMMVYALLAWALERTVWLLFYRPRESTVGLTQTTTLESAAAFPTPPEPVAVIQTITRKQYSQ